MGFGRPAWAEIDLSAIRRNIRQILSLLKPGTLFCPIVKADGYGHGAIAVAHEAANLGADYLGVAIVEEAVALRKAGISLPILVLGYTPTVAAPFVVGNNITQTVYTKKQVDALSAAASAMGLPANVHVKIDTGMTRLGIEPAYAGEFCSYITGLPGIVLEGAFTHFASADNLDKTSALGQFHLFQEALAAIAGRGIGIPIKHCANSAGVLDLPQTHLDMVRPGIILYGLWPSEETTRPITLNPAMRFKANISMIKTVESGRGVSYGETFCTKKSTVVATLPVGYADGYTRMLSNKSRIMVQGSIAPVLGRVCMDQCMADVSHIPGVQEGDEVLLFGGEELPVEEIAQLLGTINYEVVCMVGKRVPRVYVATEATDRPVSKIDP